jgi:hypothetical protein
MAVDGRRFSPGFGFIRVSTLSRPRGVLAVLLVGRTKIGLRRSAVFKSDISLR